MNKKKQLASCLVLSLSMTMAIPAWAADTTTITAQTPSVSTTQVKPNTFTLQDIQKLMVQNNSSVKSMNVALKMAETQLAMAGNSLRDAENAMQSLSYSSSSTDNSVVQSEIAGLQAQIDAITQVAGWESDPTKSATVALLESQIASLQSSLGASSGSLQSSYTSLLAARQSAESEVTSAENSKKDAEQSKDELTITMRYQAANLVIQEQQLEQSIALLQKQYDLAIKSQEIADLQKELGMATDIDRTNSYLNASQAAAQLNQTKNNLTTMKRTLNVMMGRAADAELNIAPLEMSTVITAAPTYNDQLVKTAQSKNYSLKTLQRNINSAKDQAEDLRSNGINASDQFQLIDYNIESKRLEMKNTETSVADSVKAAIDEIKTTGEAYRNSQLAYSTAQTTYEQTKLKYELGMISAIDMQSAELSLLQAETSNHSAAYAHYLANQKYQALMNGVSV